MATLNVPLPEPMEDRIEAQARTGYSINASDEVCDPIRRDQARAAKQAELQQRVTEGIASGVSTRSKDDIRHLSRELAACRRS